MIGRLSGYQTTKCLINRHSCRTATRPGILGHGTDESGHKPHAVPFAEEPLGNQSIGEFEQVVLLAILQLSSDAYAPSVARHLEDSIGRSVSRGALYSCLNQLEQKGYLRWRLDEPTPERGGHARRFYKVTAEGVRALSASRRRLLTLWQGLEGVLGPAK